MNATLSLIDITPLNSSTFVLTRNGARAGTTVYTDAHAAGVRANWLNVSIVSTDPSVKTRANAQAILQEYGLLY